MSSKEQSATLLIKNKQSMVSTLQSIGMTDVTTASKASEFPNRIKWAGGLLDLCVAAVKKTDGQKLYFTKSEWQSLSATEQTAYLIRGIRIRALGKSFIIAANDCVDENYGKNFAWGGYGKLVNGLTAIQSCKNVLDFSGKENTDLIISSLTGVTDNNSTVGCPAATAAKNYVAFSESDGRTDTSEWYLGSLGQMFLIERYLTQIQDMLTSIWSADCKILTDNHYWSSTTYSNNQSHVINYSTAFIYVDISRSSQLHVRPICNE